MKVDLTLIWLTVVKEKTISLPLCLRVVLALAPGHNQRRDPIRRRLIILIFAGSTARLVYVAELSRSKVGNSAKALFRRVNESSPDRGRVSDDTLDSCLVLWSFSYC